VSEGAIPVIHGAIPVREGPLPAVESLSPVTENVLPAAPAALPLFDRAAGKPKTLKSGQKRPQGQAPARSSLRFGPDLPPARLRWKKEDCPPRPARFCFARDHTANKSN
jgi:hypothetical protein